MCGGGGGGGADPTQTYLQQAQMQQQAAQGQAALQEQQREFDIQQQQAQQTLANLQQQQAQQQAEADKQSALTDAWQKGRSIELAQGTKSVNDAFAQFTPDYYKQYQSDYLSHYQPQIDQQYATASNNTTFGLARTGNMQSQTAANQFMQLAEQKGQAQADVNNQAVNATTALQSQVNASKQNLMGQVTSDATLGSPITPGSVDAINANWNNTNQALSTISNSAGDVVTTLQATPAYASLGSIFGSLGAAGTSAVAGNNNYNAYQAFSRGLGASSPSSSSGRIIG